MVCSDVKTKNGPAVGLYMVMIRECLNSFMSPGVEKEVKEAIKAVGGNINQSGIFLSTTSDSTIVSKATGINCQSVSFVPRDKVPDDILKELDICKLC